MLKYLIYILLLVLTIAFGIICPKQIEYSFYLFIAIGCLPLIYPLIVWLKSKL